ncbi:hypothetical protein [Planctomicrobium piriforme]|uniref:Uncharacterized protein n=1 Tax=Planctomicrobium piriforme TaxID=1576369 RepID=A0A1I3ECT3_9PLAN|nr:hypothetical protein [Planctomicrobium piriforme]SFH96755.1 hypothetical protein SAMN05421753_104167 [Planctomicrobium piriforme]
MALSNFARRLLKTGLANNAAGEEIADIIDAGTGTLSAATREFLQKGMADNRAATLFETAVEAGSAIDGYTQRYLGNMVGDAGVAREIAAALAS